MAKLPYTYTICPPGPEPVQFTASCAEMDLMLQGSPNGDLMIDPRRELWRAQHRRPRAVNIGEFLMERLGGKK